MRPYVYLNMTQIRAGGWKWRGNKEKKNKVKGFFDSSEIFQTPVFKSFLDLIFTGAWHYFFHMFCFFLCEKQLYLFNLFLIICSISPLWSTVYCTTRNNNNWCYECWCFCHIILNVTGMKNKIWKILFFSTIAKSMQLWRH